MRQNVIGVIGNHDCDKKTAKLAKELGKKLANITDVLVCGGLGGVMEAVCEGFKEAKGKISIGIIPGYEKEDANLFVDIVIPTGIGLARNVLVVKSADIVIALAGEAGTLSEIAYALQFRIPLISLKSWDIPGVIKVSTVKEAVDKVKEVLKKG
jgi:uncharacterized protein (TIGR00725 family)